MNVQIYAPHCIAGIVIESKDTWTVTRAAPIFRYMVGWTWLKVREYLTQKHWKFSFVLGG